MGKPLNPWAARLSAEAQKMVRLTNSFNEDPINVQEHAHHAAMEKVQLHILHTF